MSVGCIVNRRTDMKMTSTVQGSVVGLVVLGMVGCAGVQKVEDAVQRHKMLVKLAVSLGVSKALQGHPAEAQVVVDVVVTAKKTLAGGKIDVTQVVPLVLVQISKQVSLTPEEKQLLELLTHAVAQEVQGLIYL